MARVLVCGATGYLGRYIVTAAKREGHWVRALVRKPEGLGEAAASVDDVFVGHATDAATLEGLCDGIDVVVSSLGNRTLKRKPTCWEVDYGANMNILRRARESKVDQLVFVSVLGGEEARARVPQIEARERIVDELREGDLPFTVLRPSGFFNDMSEFFQMAKGGGPVWLVGDGEDRFNPIHGADLADVVLAQVGNEDAYGKLIPCGGPEVLTMREVGGLAFEAAGMSPKFRSFPGWALRATASVIRPFNVNVASLLLMFGVFAGRDSVTDCYGTHRLADFYRELADQA